MNNVLNNKIKPSITQSFVNENKEIYEESEIVNAFNQYFVNVGPSLATKLPIVNESVTNLVQRVFLLRQLMHQNKKFGQRFF